MPGMGVTRSKGLKVGFSCECRGRRGPCRGLGVALALALALAMDMSMNLIAHGKGPALLKVLTGPWQREWY